jgi:predicted amidohydrolase
MREITIATVQMKPELGRPENNLLKMSDFISTITSQQKVDLIVFPELITSGYELGVQFTELAQRVPGPAINLMAQRAADSGVYIAFGLATKEKVESILYNSAVLIGPEGELVGHYNKIHLRGEERMAFREGFRLPVFETGEIGRIGLMLGWDLAFPEVARALALEGADVLCCMANWEESYIDEFKTYVRARAYENALFVAAANRIGSDVTMRFGGESMIVGPRGKVFAALEAEAEARKEWLREQEALLAEVQSLRDANAALEAARDAARKEAEQMIEAARKEAALVAAGAEGESGATAAQARPAEQEGKAPVATASNPEPAAQQNGSSKDSHEGKESKASKDSRKAVSEPAKKPEPVEGYCVARIDLDEVRRYREEFQTLQARQPTVYRAIVRRY